MLSALSAVQLWCPKIIYGSSACWGFANKKQIEQLEGILKRAVRMGFYPQTGPTLEAIVHEADNILLNKVLNRSEHVLHILLPPAKNVTYNLRPRVHDRVLPIKTVTLAKNFLYRLLYRD